MSNADLDRVAAFISGAGFAVFVALWFLLKTDKRLEELTRAIEKLRVCLVDCFAKGGDYGKGSLS